MTVNTKRRIAECIGWQVYQSLQGLPFGERKIDGNYILIEDETRDFNVPLDYILFHKER